jgi:hypothetical protein
LLVELNKARTKTAALLVVVISMKNFEYNEKYSITHQYDAGAAWENLTYSTNKYLAIQKIHNTIYSMTGIAR